MLKTLLVLVVGAGFVLFTAGSLPAVVASHFVSGGAANGFMPRETYLKFMLALVVGLPLLIAVLSRVTALVPPTMINLPNRDYWLAPERLEETLAYLRGQGSFFAVPLCVLLCYVHWLVVQANALTPPHFPESKFFAGLAVFVVVLVVWLGRFVLHFRRPD